MAREQHWDKDLQLLLLLIIGFNILPHMSSIPVWSTALAFVFLTWKALSMYRGVSRPPRWFLWSVSIGCVFGVFAEYHTILGQEPASAILVTLASAKLLETNRYRDAMFVIFTSFFLLMAHLLNSQSILTTVFMAADVMMITALMFQLHKQERRHSARSFRPVMKTLGLAIPVWIFLFVAFPRFSAGFWGLKEGGRTSSGFSDNLDPGGIESLIESDEPAFRVKFNGPVPMMDQLYWRGAILTEADGLVWKKSKERTATADILVPSPKLPVVYSYEAYLEPRFQSWIFALDFPDAVSINQHGSNQLRKKSGFIFESLHPTNNAVTYSASATSLSPQQRLLDEGRERFLQLPTDLDPRIISLAKNLTNEAKLTLSTAALPTLSDRIADRTENWFMKQGFRYTKSPGPLRAGNSRVQLAQFLFETKKGFCEHYAGSFATLMRAAGVPARVTIGFLGATRNEYGGYFVVRDLDAHAWTEIWRDDANKKGVGRWVRVDPTAMIAPLRIQMGGDFNLLDPASYSGALTRADAEMKLSLRNNRLLYKAALAWDALQMKWNAFLTDYDFEFQKSFLENLGWKDVTRLALFGLATIGVFTFSVGMMVYLRRRAHRPDPVLEAWRELGKKLERAGLARRKNEGPLDFTSRAASMMPQIAAELETLGVTYAKLRYGVTDHGTKEFRRAVRDLEIRK